MKKIVVMAFAMAALSACDSEPKFKVEGEVTGAEGKMLYLEASALEGIVPLDSVSYHIYIYVIHSCLLIIRHQSLGY